jgi:putative methyltransferase (TIGR04325 family)
MTNFCRMAGRCAEGRAAWRRQFETPGGRIHSGKAGCFAMRIGQVLKAILPPVITHVLRRIRLAIMPESIGLTFAPEAWKTRLPVPSEFAKNAFVENEKAQWHATWQPFFSRLERGGLATHIPDAPLPLQIEDHNSWVTYAYVLQFAARGRSRLKILDYGGNLGYFYWVGKALLPDVALEYHCKDLPEIVREGRALTPQVIWHTDDSCLNQQYDLLIFSAVLQYIEEWEKLLGRAAGTAQYIYIAQTPTVERVDSYVAVQRLAGFTMLHQQINKTKLHKAFAAAKLHVVREFVDCDHYLIYDAPEQPRYYTCLLQSAAAAS